MRNYIKPLFSTVFQTIITIRNGNFIKRRTSSRLRWFLRRTALTHGQVLPPPRTHLNQPPVTRVPFSWISNAHHLDTYFYHVFSSIPKGGWNTHPLLKSCQLLCNRRRRPTACTRRHLSKLWSQNWYLIFLQVVFFSFPLIKTGINLPTQGLFSNIPNC